MTATISHLPLATSRSTSHSSQAQQKPQQHQSSSVSSAETSDEDSSRTIDSNSIQWRFENTSGRSVIESLPLKRVFLTNRTVTCNDGSQAGFYLRKSNKSKRWVVFFEGGWHCYDTESCKTRWTKLRHLMTSAKWPAFREDGKLLF